jgi:hypothetical protein
MILYRDVSIEDLIEDFYCSGASSETNLFGYMRRQGFTEGEAITIYNDYYKTDYKLPTIECYKGD